MDIMVWCHWLPPRRMGTACSHGQRTSELLHDGNVIDLKIVAGDWDCDCETMRTEEALKSYKAPPRYQVMGTFHKVCNGEIYLPRLTLLIGGNDEASDVLHLLPFGGWLAPNIFELSGACSVSFGDTIISSLSGLWKPEDCWRPVNEASDPRRIKQPPTTFHNLDFLAYFLPFFGYFNFSTVSLENWVSDLSVTLHIRCLHQSNLRTVSSSV
jgi:hypothetical protein